ncbi:MAG: hypothetical protein HZB67_01675 [Candidatus Aenigmarchaeota archaeon]|nr:hypothetical protein [Candidatus Aenigmarchaeota archaeon]
MQPLMKLRLRNMKPEARLDYLAGLIFVSELHQPASKDLLNAFKREAKKSTVRELAKRADSMEKLRKLPLVIRKLEAKPAEVASGLNQARFDYTKMAEQMFLSGMDHKDIAEGLKHMGCNPMHVTIALYKTGFPEKRINEALDHFTRLKKR